MITSTLNVHVFNFNVSKCCGHIMPNGAAVHFVMLADIHFTYTIFGMQVYQDDLQIKLAFCTSLTIFDGIINLVQPVGDYVFLCNTIHTFIHFVYFDLNFECATYQKSGAIQSCAWS